MKAVGIKELKAHLSEYVRQARSGETVLVTDRNQVVAELSPPRRTSNLKSEDYRQEDLLVDLAASGQVTRAEVGKGSWSWQVKGLGLPEGSAEKLLRELRGDRDEDH